MPKVPTYSQTEVDRPILRTEVRTQANPDDFGAGIGRGMAAAAQGLAQASDAFAHVQQIEDVASAQDAETKFSDWQREATYGSNGFLTLSGSAAVSARKDYEKQLREQSRSFGQNLTPGARQLYTQAVDGRVASALESAIIHTARETKTMAIGASSSRAQSFANDAIAGWSDGRVVDQSLADGVDELRRQAQLAGWDADTTQLKIETYTSAVRADVLTRQAMQDPIAAADWMYSNPEALTPEDGQRVAAAVLPAVKSAAARESALTADGGVEVSERIGALLSKLPDAVEAEVRSGIVDELLAAQTQAAAQTKAAYVSHKGSLELAILTGDLSSEEKIIADPVLADDDKATLLRSLRTEQNSTGAARQYLNGLANGTASTLNPYDTDDRETAEKSYKILMGAVQPEQAAPAAIEFVRESGVIPKAMVASVRNGLASTDGAAVAEALQLSAGLYDAAPTAMGAVEGGKEIETAVAVYREMVTERGITVEAAAQRLIDLRDPEKQAKADVLKKGWEEARKSLSVQDVRNTFDTSFLIGEPSAGLTPLAQSALTADYLAAAERAFTGPAQGDVGIAKQMALAEMKRTYGVSRVTGEEVIMRYPPEAFYPPIAGGHDYIRDLALADARSIDPKASKIMLLPGADTARDVRDGQPPRYSLMYQDASGVWQTAPGSFVVDGGSIADMGALDSRERQIQFEIDRVRRREFSDPAYGSISLDLKTLETELTQVRAERSTIAGGK